MSAPELSVEIHTNIVELRDCADMLKDYMDELEGALLEAKSDPSTFDVTVELHDIREQLKKLADVAHGDIFERADFRIDELQEEAEALQEEIADNDQLLEAVQDHLEHNDDVSTRRLREATGFNLY